MALYAGEKKRRKNTKGEKHRHVLALMMRKGGSVRLDDPELVKIIGAHCMYRAVVYFSYIRRFNPCYEVRPIKSGRKVVGYSLISVESPVAYIKPGTKEWQHSKYWKGNEFDTRTAASIYKMKH